VDTTRGGLSALYGHGITVPLGLAFGYILQVQAPDALVLVHTCGFVSIDHAHLCQIPSIEFRRPQSKHTVRFSTTIAIASIQYTYSDLDIRVCAILNPFSPGLSANSYHIADVLRTGLTS
jgi:hypothetical protein